MAYLWREKYGWLSFLSSTLITNSQLLDKKERLKIQGRWRVGGLLYKGYGDKSGLTRRFSRELVRQFLLQGKEEPLKQRVIS